MNYTELDQLYIRYGYELKNKYSNKDVRIYILNKGVYYGADIIIKDDTIDYSSIFKELSDSGYACRVKCFKNLESANAFLFDSFFHSTQLNERLKSRYDNFFRKQTSHLKVPYEYIPVCYLRDNEEFKADKNIIDSVISILQDKGPQLIIIEAAAGYGKTCTSYEIIKNISLNVESLSPIFTELSRDRRAAIFKHVLQDVIVNEFQSLLDEELVIHEIQNGKIPLIIDGFDELLSKEQDNANNEFEQVETMLSTIGELLIGRAKIIITGRKTAIFSGDSFNQWIDTNPNNFSVNRFLLNPPRIEDWLSETKINIIKDANIPINHIANPVLLAFLRSLEDNDFLDLSKGPNLIVSKYFNSLLDREQERQDLNISSENQLNIFRKLALGMIEFDITSDSKDWIKMIILDKNYTLIESIRKSYPSTQRPSQDELVNTLSNHALLDRKGQNEDCVGFINEFIYGTLIGENIIQDDFKISSLSSRQIIELAITAFQFQAGKNRERLYSKVKDIKFFSKQDKLVTEYMLSNNIEESFTNATFNDLSINNLDIENTCQFTNCVFANCTFEYMIFSNISFSNTSFVNCVFNQCKYISSNTKSNINLINSNDYGCGFVESVEKESSINTITDSVVSDENVLSHFIDSAGRARSKDKKLSSIIKSYDANLQGNISNILNKLKIQKYILINGDNACITELGYKYLRSK